jgi:ribonuclease HIII
VTDVDIIADQLLQQFWHTGGTDEATAAELRKLVLHESPSSALLAGRCLPVLDLLSASNAWAARIDDFRAQVTRLVRRCHQIDQLGDPNTEPEALFEILADAVDALSIEAFDPNALRQSRIGKPNRAAAAVAFLTELGLANLPEYVAVELRAAASELTKRAAAYQAVALFTGPTDTGFALGVQVAGATTGTVTGYNDADGDMAQQARAVLTEAYNGRGAKWSVEWELSFGGSSIGLALQVAALVEQGRAAVDPLLAATGRIRPDGHVAAVGSITQKVKAAVAGGFRRILVPADNEGEARAGVDEAPDVTVLAVSHVEQLPTLLAGLTGAIPIGVDGSLRFVRKLLPLYGLELIGEYPLEHGYRLEVADATSRARVDVFRGSRGTIQASGSGTALQAADQLVEERLPRTRMQPRGSLSVLVASPARRERLLELLDRQGAQQLPTTNDYETWRYRLADGPSQATIVGYTNGRVVVPNGQAPAHDTATGLVRAVLEGLGGLPGPTGTTAAADPSATTDYGTATGTVTEVPHIGTDEAGKGDYFGPLVCAACFVDAESAAALRALGVRDSKTLSDKAIRRLAAEIRSRFGRRFAVITIPPARYNELYEQFRREGKNLNTLVAWGHARGIEDVLSHGVRPEYAVIDKFADERYMQQKLLADTRRSGLRLDQRTKGESDVAVAAASILARDGFVTWLEERSRKLGFPLPKGASAQVIVTARRIVADRGEKALSEVAKLSFKTTRQVLEGLGERRSAP